LRFIVAAVQVESCAFGHHQQKRWIDTCQLGKRPPIYLGHG